MKKYLGDFCMFCHVFLFCFVFSISRFIWRILPFLGRCRQSVTCWVQRLQDCPAGCKTVFSIYWISLIFSCPFHGITWLLKLRFEVYTHIHYTHTHVYTQTDEKHSLYTSCIWPHLLLFQGEDTYLEGNYALTNNSITSMNVRMQHIAIKHHV